MLSQFLTIGILMLLSAMLPGPDFAIVTKNTVLHSRRAGIFTSFGIGIGLFVHVTYCALGLAFIIYHSPFLFTLIKLLGAAYLFYLGSKLIFNKHKTSKQHETTLLPRTHITDFVAFQQGFLCNLLNPKAAMFFLALFTMIIKPGTPRGWEMLYAVEMFVIVVAWFCSLAFLLSHSLVSYWLDKAIVYIEKILGIFLIGCAVALAFMGK